VALFIGLMSGTSLDGVDGVLIDLDGEGKVTTLRGHHHEALGDAVHDELLALNRSEGVDELHRAARAASALARVYASVVTVLLYDCAVHARDIVAIGAHGQTVRHRPEPSDGGYTLQLLNGALLAELTRIDVVCDLRSRDVAAGGQGAPLVPAFHADCFGAAGEARAALNLGGIANLTLLHADGRVGGFDCGPASVLLDAWTARHRGAAYDEGGRWAAQGHVDATLLQQFLAEPYLHRAPPKSTGRDLFHIGWLDAQLARSAAKPSAVDVQATLSELTARAAADALQQHLPSAHRLIVCGGGAFNDHLMGRLSALLPSVRVATSDAHGLPPQQVESVAFAWMAREFLQGRSANRPEVTGAAGARRLGCLYPSH
jgi:anhydro-N-acetylmuramic acid kinase